MTRQEILKAAKECVCKDRNATHGEPENSFGAIARLWSARLGVTLQGHQVAIMLMDLKTARAWDNQLHKDNWVDMAGYAACGGEVAAKEYQALLDALDVPPEVSEQKSCDLEPTVEHQVWNNVYPDGFGRLMRNSRLEADKAHDRKTPRAGVLRIDRMSDGTVRTEMEDAA